MRTGQIAVVLAVVTLVAGGCGTSTVPPSPGSSGGGGQSAAPVDGGTLTYVMPDDVVSLDMDQGGGGNTSVSVRNMIYEGLVTYKPNVQTLDIVPQLATSWETEGNTWTFHLRQGVKFTDGTPFNAAAVKAHFDRLLGPEKPPAARNWTPFVASVDAVDDSTVKFTTKAFDPALLDALASFDGAVESPAAFQKYGKDIGTHPVGTGPFEFVEWVPDDHVTLQRNDEYWGGKPHLDKVVVRPVPDAGARLSALQAGDIQLATQVQPEQLAQIRSDSSLSLDEWITSAQLFVGLNNLKDPFTNVKVRQALNYAIDWNTIASSLYQGMATPIGGPLPLVFPGVSQVSPFSYDVAKAKSLLAEAGQANGFSTTFVTPTGAYLKDAELAQVLQQQLAQVGVHVTLQNVEFAKYLDLVRQPTKTTDRTIWVDYWSRDIPVGILRDRYHCDSFRPAGVNLDGYCNQAVDKLIVDAESSQTADARLAALNQAQTMIANDAASIWGLTLKAAWAIKTNVHGALHSLDGGIWADANTWIGG